MLFYFFRRRDLPLTGAGIITCTVEAFLGPVSNILIGKIFTALSEYGVGLRNSEQFMDRVLEMCAGLWALSLIQFFASWFSYTIWTLIGYRQGHRARSQLYRASVSHGFDWLDQNENNKQVGVATMSFKDVQDLEQAVGSTMRDMISASVSLILQLVVAFYYSWSVTFISLAGMPIMIVCTVLISAKVNAKVVAGKTLLDCISTRADWVLRCLTTVICLQRQPYEEIEMANSLKQEMKINMEQHQYSALLQGIGRFLMLSIFVQGFFFGSYMVRNHGLDSGSVMTVFWSCMAVAGGLNTILNHLVGLQKGIVSAHRLVSNLSRNDLEEFKSGIGIMPPELEPGMGEVKFDDVVFSYPSRPAVVLAGLSLSFRAGQTTFVLGPSGSGKSSIGSLICGHYLYQAGQITINDVPVPHLSPRWIANNVYIVEQHTKLFDTPLAENIRIGARHPLDVTFDDIERVCELAGVDFLSDLPNGLLTAGSYPLSGGQRQRIGIATGFIRDAPIMIFDESTSALDPSLRSFVIASILKFRQDKTTIIITHDMSLIPANMPMYFVQDGRACFFRSVDQYKRQSVVPFQPKSATQRPPSSSETEEIDSAAKTARFFFKTVQHKALLCLGFVLVCAQAAVNPVFGFVFSKLLLGILPNSGVNVTLWALLVLLLAFVDGALTYSHIALDFVSESWQLHIRNLIYKRLLSRRRLPLPQVPYYTKLLFSDTERASLIVASYWPAMVNLGVLGLMAFIWCMAEGWELSLIGLSISPLFFFATQCYKVVSVKWNEEREKRRSRTLKLLVEVVEGIRAVKSQHLEAYFGDLYNLRESKTWEIAIPMAAWVGIMHGFVAVFPFAAQGLLLWYGMHLISELRYTTEQTMMVFTILIFALMTMSGIASAITSVSNGFEASNRLASAAVNTEDQDICPVVQAWDTQDYEGLDFRRLTFTDIGITYPNGTSVLGGFNLDIAANETVAIVGPSGAGKSTIARMLLKLQAPTQGTIYVDNLCDLEKIPQDIVRSKVAVVSQMPLDFLDDTIMNNLLYALPSQMPRDVAKRLAIKACCDCGLEKFISELEDGYHTRITSGLLSGGQMQRFGIARCLIREPQTLVLDECTSALDIESIETIKNLLLEIKNTRTMTLVIITHQMEVTTIADRVISLL